jgi:histidinol-phosphate aminotransferase
VCQQIVQSTAGPGDEVVYAWRSFEAYLIIVTDLRCALSHRAVDR